MGFLVVGIDPGFDGAIVAVHSGGELVAAHRMPKTRGALDLDALAALILDPAQGGAPGVPLVYAVEDVHSVAVYGTRAAAGAGTIATAKSNFGLGRYRGHLEMALRGRQVEWLRTDVWQGLMLGTRRISRQTKALARAKALALFPALPELVAFRGAGEIPDGVADAALIAECARRVEIGRARKLA